jgi:hypothetical protein
VSRVHGLLSLQPVVRQAWVGAHTPAEQVPATPDAEEHVEPSGWVWTRQPEAGSQNASKQGPSSVGHCMAVPARQVELRQVSVPLQTSPSPHAIGVPATQTRFTQRSAPLHASPSPHCPSVLQA